jgi:hypothetical protein
MKYDLNKLILTEKYLIKYIESVMEQAIWRRCLFVLVLSGIIYIIFTFNRLTPWVVDDILKGADVQNNFHDITDYVNHIYHFYFVWGGRIWGELYAMFFLSFPKSIFNILNTFGYIILILLMYINCTGKLKMSVSLLVFINFSLFAFLPAFGQDILWISGCSNYMWALLIPLAYLSLWKIYDRRAYPIYKSKGFLFLIVFLGVLTGWSNENVSVGILGILIGYMLLYKKKCGTYPIFSIVGVISTSIGSVLLWLAPGNFMRFASEHHTTSIIKIIHQMIHNFFSLFDFQSTLFLFIMLVVFIYFNKEKNKWVPCIFVLGTVLSAISLGVVGSLVSRVVFSGVVFMTIAVGMLYNELNCCIDIKKIKCIITVMLILGTYNFYSDAKQGLVDFNDRWNENIQIIETSKARGDLDVVVNPIFPQNRFCAAYLLDDIQPASKHTHWLNRGVANYYKLNTIQSVYIK